MKKRLTAMVAAGIAGMVVASPAQALCGIGSAPVIADVRPLVDSDPRGVLATVTRRLADPHLSTVDRGWLLATQAAAYSTLEQGDEETAAADRGLALIRDPRLAPYSELVAQKAAASNDPAMMESSLTQLAAARRFLTPGSSADICSRAVSAWLEFSLGRHKDALAHMMQAYRDAGAAGLDAERADIGFNLSGILMKSKDLVQAERLNALAIQWAEAHGQTARLAAAYYVKGLMRIQARDHAGALTLFERSAGYARRMGSAQFLGFTALSSCESYVFVKRFAQADAACRDAERILGAHIVGPRIARYRAAAALGLKRYDEAIRRAGAIIDGPAKMASVDGRTAAYRIRAQAFAATGDDGRAYRDLVAYADRSAKEKDAQNDKAIAELRTRLGVQAEVERNAALRRDLSYARERARFERNRLITLAGLVGVLCAMIGYIVWNGRRHRRALEQLATTDALTGLANRRAADDQTATALARATDARTPVTVALIDIDHFKAINDEHGHAAGDAALTELAGVLRATVRSSDVVGRWGGEEFLLVLPGLDALGAAEVVSRVRRAAAALARPIRFSAGIAQAAPGERELSPILSRADEALYAAKCAGRDRNVIAGDSATVDDRRGAAVARTEGKADAGEATAVV